MAMAPHSSAASVAAAAAGFCYPHRPLHCFGHQGRFKDLNAVYTLRTDGTLVDNALILARFGDPQKHRSHIFLRVKLACLVDNDIPSNTSTISEVHEGGSIDKEFEELEELFTEGKAVPNEAVLSLAKRCKKEGNLACGKQLHNLIIKNGLLSDITIANQMIEMFSSVGSFSEVNEIFNKLPEENASSWSVVISSFVKYGQNVKALEMYNKIRESHIEPDSDIYINAIKACCILKDCEVGKLIHNHIVESGYDLNVFVSNALIEMYCKCKDTENARRVFDKLQVKSFMSWNTMIGGYCHSDQIEKAFTMFKDMQREGYTPNDITFLYLLKACTNLASLEELHARIIENGQEPELHLCNTLIYKYNRHNAFEDACILFERMQTHDIITWNAMITAYSQQEYFLEQTLCLFQLMQQEGISPDIVTFLGLVTACSAMGCLDTGNQVHADIITHGLEHEPCIGSCIVNMYSKCGNLQDAIAVFAKFPKKNVILWNTIITAYLEHNHSEEVLSTLEEMQVKGINPDRISYMSALRACSDLLALEEGRRFHSVIAEKGFDVHLSIKNTLIDMYGKCGKLDDARMMFDKSEQRSFVTWNAMIGGYTQHGHGQEALQLFLQMKQENIEPDKVAYIYLLKACSSTLALEKGRKIHDMINEAGLVSSDMSVANTLVDMYAKCGSLKDAQDLFDELEKRDVVTWTALISGYADQNDYDRASQLFDEMQQSGIKPDDISYLILLSACSHKGLVSEGLSFFKEMREKYDILPNLQHYDCIVDLLACKGMLEEAEDLLETIPFQANLVGWISLLGVCRLQKNIEISRRCFNNVITLDKDHAAAYVLMSRIYASLGMYEEANELEQLRRGDDVWKVPGKAFIEVDETLHYFTAQDKSHPQTDSIHAKLEALNFETKRLGLEVVSSNSEKGFFCRHSEKLAVVFGLLNTSPEKPIRVGKNLRICDDCHQGIKIISKVEAREIIVRDIDCIHTFKDGLCSCNDRYYPI